MRWIGRARQAIFRVTASDEVSVSFDALLILGRRRHATTRVLKGERTPFELALSDTDLIAVVRPREVGRQLGVEYALMRGTQRVLYGRSWWPVPALQRTGHRILVAGVGEAPSDRGGSQASSPSPA